MLNQQLNIESVYDDYAKYLVDRTGISINNDKSKLAICPAIRKDVELFFDASKGHARPPIVLVVGDNSVDVRLIPDYIDLGTPTVAQSEIFGDAQVSFGGTALVSDIIRGFSDFYLSEAGEITKRNPTEIKCFIVADRFLVNALRQANLMPVVQAIYQRFPRDTKSSDDKMVWRIERHLGIMNVDSSLGARRTKDSDKRLSSDGPSPYLACLSHACNQLTHDRERVEMSPDLLVIVDSLWGGKERFYDAVSGLADKIHHVRRVVIRPKHLVHRYKDRYPNQNQGKQPIMERIKSAFSYHYHADTAENDVDLTVEPQNATLVISANELRRNGVFVSYRMSWERTVQNILGWCIKNSESLEYDNVVVSFGPNGAVCLSKVDGSFSKGKGFLVTIPGGIEGDVYARQPGKLRGYESALVAAICTGIIQHRELSDVHLRISVISGVKAAYTVHNTGETHRSKICKFSRSISTYDVPDPFDEDVPASGEQSKRGNSHVDTTIFFPLDEVCKVLHGAHCTQDFVSVNIPRQVFDLVSEWKED